MQQYLKLIKVRDAAAYNNPFDPNSIRQVLHLLLLNLPRPPPLLHTACLLLHRNAHRILIIPPD